MTNRVWLRRRTAAAVLGVISVPMAGIATADVGTPAGLTESVPVLQEIVVTATKRSESIQEVPLSITAISAADIASRGLTDYSDYLDTVPGVYFEDAGPGQSQIRIRGIVADETGGSASTVATYFGETLTSAVTVAGGKPDLRLVDIDRVEVLRGPQGSLFGANSLAGVVRIIPNAPNLRDFQVRVDNRDYATAHSSAGSYDTDGVLNIPLVQDRLAIRLVGYDDRTAGYIDNIVPARAPIDYSAVGDADLGLPPGAIPPGTLVIPGNPALSRNDINSEDTWGARAAIRWQALDFLQIDLNHATQYDRLNSEAYVQPVAGPYDQQRFMDNWSQGFNLERLDLDSLVVKFEPEGFTLTSVSSYTRMQSAYSDDASLFVQASFGVPIPWEDHTSSEGKVFTEEVRVNSSGNQTFHWLAGAFYLDQTSDVNQTVIDHSCPTCIPTLLFGQGSALSLAPGADPRLLDEQQRSIFGQVSYEIGPRWSVGLGGRYLEDNVEHLQSALEGFLAGGSTPEEVAGGTAHEANPSAYVRFKPSTRAMVYAQAARGFRSAQTNSALSYTGPCAAQAAAAGLGPLTQPDTLWNYELGTKTQWMDNRVNVNGDVYRQIWKGVQLPVQFNCGFGGTVNGGNVSGTGAELELAARVGEGWLLNLSASYVHNTFDSVKPGVGFAIGEEVPGAPAENASAGLEYDFSLNSSWSGFARADYVYVGRIQYIFGQTDERIVDLGAYGIGTFRLAFRRAPIGVDLFCNNITDKRAVVNTTDPLQGVRDYLTRPREIGVELHYSYR